MEVQAQELFEDGASNALASAFASEVGRWLEGEGMKKLLRLVIQQADLTAHGFEPKASMWQGSALGQAGLFLEAVEALVAARGAFSAENPGTLAFVRMAGAVARAESEVARIGGELRRPLQTLCNMAPQGSEFSVGSQASNCP